MDFKTCTHDELGLAKYAHDRSGPRGLFQFANKRLPQNTEEVEDCAIAFYTAYNNRVCTTY